MKILTIDSFPGREIEALCLVQGSIVLTNNVGRDLVAGMHTLVGGEITDYTRMINEGRSIATERMVKEAIKIKADAIIGARYEVSSVMQGTVEISVYGTAINFK